MEKDVDEVGKIARGVKAKLEAINRDVFDLFTCFLTQFTIYIVFCKYVFFYASEYATI